MEWITHPISINKSPKEKCATHVCFKVKDGVCGLNWCITRACFIQI